MLIMYALFGVYIQYSIHARSHLALTISLFLSHLIVEEEEL